MTEVTNNKTFGKKMIQSLSRAVDNAVLLLLLVCLIFAGYSLWDTHKVYEDASSAKYETYKPVSEEETKSFEELRAMNPDVLGWITIYDTMIDYPLVQSKVSNNEYLSRNPEKEFESSGSIYLDTHKCSVIWNCLQTNTFSIRISMGIYFTMGKTMGLNSLLY